MPEVFRSAGASLRTVHLALLRGLPYRPVAFRADRLGQRHDHPLGPAGELSTRCGLIFDAGCRAESVPGTRKKVPGSRSWDCLRGVNDGLCLGNMDFSRTAGREPSWTGGSSPRPGTIESAPYPPALLFVERFQLVRTRTRKNPYVYNIFGANLQDFLR